MEKNLNSKEAIEKLQALVKDIVTCMFFTNTQAGIHNTRPMAVVEVDMNGNLWFFASLQSAKVQDIEKDNHVHLVFSNPSKDSFLDLRGRASIENDRKSIEDRWIPIVKAWFPEGKNDPDLCLIKVKTDEAHYWDRNSTKMVDIVKTISSVVTGKQMVEGIHGDLLV
ncbi:MAG: pyridoxamine 5'-phosphate oxidase family protein [Ferruginibacter sp.]|nr:pyridoxamine 5'-phosphate oxidase family protein [Ferruginibacter sp.]